MVSELDRSRRRAPRLDAGRDAGAVRPAVPRADLPARSRRIGAFRSAAACSSRRCCRSRPAAVPRIAPIARRARITTPDVEAAKLMDVADVLAEARARAAGRARRASAWARPGASPRTAISTRSAPWSSGVKALGLESCVTLGMLTEPQARAAQGGRARLLQSQSRHLARNITAASSRRAPIAIGSTRSAHVREAGIKVCCGGIVGMGESREDRVGMIHALATLPEHPESVPINLLVRVEGTPLARGGAARRARVRAHDRGRAHHHAALDGAALGRARGDERRDAGAVLPRRRQLDLLRPEAADHAQSRARPRSPRCSTGSAWRPLPA